EFCQKINKMKEMGEIDCKILYENKDQLNACENLKQTFNQRIEECFDLILNKNVTSQNYSIEKDCQILLKSIK
ncbi:MAG: hypothetical protein NZ893_02060, partial [Candidatus Aenigmarchaeota archaeon]|nr:hypothetical protein [Candidatus Aenigmarchaeota archaeon]